MKSQNLKGIPLLQLRHFHLQHNKLTSIPDHMFAPLVPLKLLYLDNTRISSIHQYGFASLAKLVTLSLQYNKICCMSSDTFATLTNVQHLYLQHNELTTVCGCAFASQAQLHTLSHDRNNISAKLTNLTFFLKIINLSNNGIPHICAHAFTTLKTLVDLHLDHNKIRLIDSKHFRSLTNQIKLSLSPKGNQVSRSLLSTPVYTHVCNCTFACQAWSTKFALVFCPFKARHWSEYYVQILVQRVHQCQMFIQMSHAL